MFDKILNTLPLPKHAINSISTNVRFLYSLKTSQNCRFSDVFMGHRSRKLVENGLKKPSLLQLLASKFKHDP